MNLEICLPTARRSDRVFHCEYCGLTMDRDLNAAKNLAALAKLACTCLPAQLLCGTPVDWSKLPIRPDGWKRDQDTRSSRGCARAGGRKAARPKEPKERRGRPPVLVQTETAPLIGKSLSPPALSALSQAPHPVPRRRCPDASSVCP
ncbi:MAG: zinc ribbon domain-containing protein [Acidimicrobiales bacterium]